MKKGGLHLKGGDHVLATKNLSQSFHKSYRILKYFAKELANADDNLYEAKNFSLPVAGRETPTLNWQLAWMLKRTN